MESLGNSRATRYLVIGFENVSEFVISCFFIYANQRTSTNAEPDEYVSARLDDPV